MKVSVIFALALLCCAWVSVQAQHPSASDGETTWQSGERHHLLLHVTTSAAFPMARITIRSGANPPPLEYPYFYTTRVNPEVEFIVGTPITKRRTRPLSTTYLIAHGSYSAYTPSHSTYMVDRIHGSGSTAVTDMPDNYRWTAGIGILAGSWFRVSAGYTGSVIMTQDEASGRVVRNAETSPHVVFGFRVRFGENVIGSLEQSFYYSDLRPGTYGQTMLGVGLRFTILTE